MSKAPVETQHKSYTKMAPKWKRCRDVIAGQDAVKDAGKDYLPALTEQKDDDYKAYKLRAKYLMQHRGRSRLSLASYSASPHH